MHISYGIGFIIGLFYFYHKWNDTKLSDDCFNIEEFLANKSEYRQ
tara:strand:- start:295 stop:429 length:135 start_codon:yes stop_codon:yes gene_type:complete